MEARPKLRFDLTAHRHSSDDARGFVVLKDAVSGKYYRLSAFEYRLLEALDGSRTVEEAMEFLRQRGYYYDLAVAKRVASKAAQHGLLLGTGYGTARHLLHLRRITEKAKRLQFLSRIYFLFIPLWNPDAFLSKTLGIVRMFANRWTGVLAATASMGALYLLMAGWSRVPL
jgi:putative peptide zinc metalloprotease protein